MTQSSTNNQAKLGSIILKINMLKQTRRDTTMQIAKLLCEVQDQALFDGQYQTFDDFLASPAVDYHRATAYLIMAIWRDQLMRSNYSTLGTAKAKLLMQQKKLVVDQALIDQVKVMTVKDATDFIHNGGGQGQTVTGPLLTGQQFTQHVNSQALTIQQQIAALQQQKAIYQGQIAKLQAKVNQIDQQIATLQANGPTP